MSYDIADRLTKIEYPGGRGFGFKYDAVGRLVSRVASDGFEERFSYDAEGRLASVADKDGEAFLSNEYDVQTGRIVKQTYGNGSSVKYAYDLLGRITSIIHADAGGKEMEKFAYTYDVDGKCQASLSKSGWETYAYDADGQLTAAFYPDGTKDAFSYDAVGNRTSVNGVPCKVNALNEYTSVGEGEKSVSFAYDLDGNLVSQTTKTGTTAYFYDVLNRLVAVTNETTGIRWSCRYDALGNRISVIDNGVTTDRVFHLGPLPSVAVEYVDGKLTRRHIVVGALQIAEIAGDGAARYFHGDIIGSVRLVTDGKGRELSRASYSAFGSFRDCGNSPRPQSPGYVGMLGVETDSTGLLFMRNRYYSPVLGRFITPDPIGFNGGDVNWYRYCRNDPVMEVDPFGLFSLSEFWNAAKQEAGLQNGVLGSFAAEKSAGFVGGSIVNSIDSQIANQFGDGGLRQLGRGLVELTAKEGQELQNLRMARYGATVVQNAGTILSVAGLAKDFLPAVMSGEWETAADITRRWALRQALTPLVAAEEVINMAKAGGERLGEIVEGARSYDRKKKNVRSQGNRRDSARSGNDNHRREIKDDDKSNDEDRELSPEEIPDPDNDDYVWCEDVCGDEGLKPVCPKDTENAVYWGCSRCGHVIRKKARKAKHFERALKAQGKEGHWFGTQFAIRQAKSVDEKGAGKND